ncbi:hypothetical protein [Streptomyces sp. NPDC001135]
MTPRARRGDTGDACLWHGGQVPGHSVPVLTGRHVAVPAEPDEREADADAAPVGPLPFQPSMEAVTGRVPAVLLMVRADGTAGVYAAPGRRCADGLTESASSDVSEHRCPLRRARPPSTVAGCLCGTRFTRGEELVADALFRELLAGRPGGDR